MCTILEFLVINGLQFVLVWLSIYYFDLSVFGWSYGNEISNWPVFLQRTTHKGVCKDYELTYVEVYIHNLNELFLNSHFAQKHMYQQCRTYAKKS